MNAVVQVEEAPVIRLDLGCGKNKHAPDAGGAWLGIDRRQFDGVDGVTDLTKKQWKFERNFGPCVPAKGVSQNELWILPDNSVTEVHCSHFLEHLHHNADKPERVNFMNELYRVLIPGGKATMITPHWASNRAYGDFTHADKPVSEMFYYYLAKKWRSENAPDNDAEWNPDGYSCDFEATWGYGMRQDLLTRNQEYQMFALQNYKEAASDLIATLVAKK